MSKELLLCYTNNKWKCISLIYVLVGLAPSIVRVMVQVRSAFSGITCRIQELTPVVSMTLCLISPFIHGLWQMTLHRFTLTPCGFSVPLPSHKDINWDTSACLVFYEGETPTFPLFLCALWKPGWCSGVIRWVFPVRVRRKCAEGNVCGGLCAEKYQEPFQLLCT